jgi:4'-phosphopantetheinyl transferase
LPEFRRKSAFLAAWTRKEAVAKALGQGLRVPLDKIEVSIASETRPRLLDVPTQDIADWQLHHVDAGRDYVSTIALRRPGR